MNSRLLTLRFFRRYLRNQDIAITPITHELEQLNQKLLSFDEYPAQGQCLGTMVFTHGMTRTANRDPRIIKFAKTMASIGFRMLVPLYPAIQALDVSTETVDDIATSFATFLQHGFCTNDKLSVFSVSFSGAQTIRAISHANIAPHIVALLALGTANNYLTTFEEILDPKSSADAYVKMLLLHNVLLHGTAPYPAELQQVMNAAIDDAYVNNDLTRMFQYGANLPPPLKLQYETLIHKLMHTHDIFVEYESTIANIQAKFLLSGNLKNLQTPISLIHSMTDKVLLPSESEALFKELKQLGVKTHLTITPLLDHVDTTFSLKKTGAAWKLFNGFNFFFKHAIVT